MKNTVADFWSRVEVRGSNECWEWQAGKSRGYGYFHFCGNVVLAHRFAMSTVQDIQNGMHVLHKCDNRSCCNPAHLFLGTNDDNIADKMSKGRHRTPKGEEVGSSKLTEAEAFFIKHSDIQGSDLAKIFGVSHPSICAIKKGRTWKHLP